MNNAVPENTLGMFIRDLRKITTKFRSPACHAFKVQECKLTHADFKYLYFSFKMVQKIKILMNQDRLKKHLLI